MKAHIYLMACFGFQAHSLFSAARGALSDGKLFSSVPTLLNRHTNVHDKSLQIVIFVLFIPCCFLLCFLFQLVFFLLVGMWGVFMSSQRVPENTKITCITNELVELALQTSSVSSTIQHLAGSFVTSQMQYFSDKCHTF